MITLNDYLYSGDTVLKILLRYSSDLKKEALEFIAYRIVISLPLCHVSDEDELEALELQYLYEIADAMQGFLEERGFTPEFLKLCKVSFAERERFRRKTCQYFPCTVDAYRSKICQGKSRCLNHLAILVCGLKRTEWSSDCYSTVKAFADDIFKINLTFWNTPMRYDVKIV